MDGNSRPQNTSPVGSSETLARYVFKKNHIRANNTLHPAVFVPWSHAELSMTRHIGLMDGDIWFYGGVVAEVRKMPLQGRADTPTHAFIAQALRVVAAPLANNPNHCNAVDWPADSKDAQLERAQEIAKFASGILAPATIPQLPPWIVPVDSSSEPGPNRIAPTTEVSATRMDIAKAWFAKQWQRLMSNFR